MKNLVTALALLLATAFPAFGQVPLCPSVDLTCPAFTQGFTPSPAQWQNWWASRQNTLGYTPLNAAGGTMTGPLITAASLTTGAGFNVPQGTAPTSPNNGDMWITSSGVFFRVAGVTVGPVAAAGGIYLQVANNLSDLANPATARTNLSLGTAATQNTGTSGANLPFTNGVNTWSGLQTYSGGLVSNFTATDPVAATSTTVTTLTFNTTTGANSQAARSIFGTATVGAANTQTTSGQLIGVQGSGSITSGAAGTIGQIIGMAATSASNSATATATVAKSLLATAPTIANSGTITNGIAIQGSPGTVATNNTTLLLSSSVHAGNFAIYSDEALQSFFSGGFTIGSPTGGYKGAGTINATQVFQNGNQLISGPNYAEAWLTSGTTWTSPSWVTANTTFHAEVIGGGGGGGGTAIADYAVGGAGGGTAVVSGTNLIAASTAYTIAIGAAGTAGAATPTAGGNGGNTTMVIGATTYTGSGGSGGAIGSASVGFSFGGTATNGNIANLTGTLGRSDSGPNGPSWGGSASLWGSGGFVLGGSRQTATGFGAGGSGAPASGTANAGTAGAIHIIVSGS